MIGTFMVTQKLNYGVYVLQDVQTLEKFEIMFEFHNLQDVNVGDRLDLEKSYMDRKWKDFTQPYAFEGVMVEDVDHVLSTTPQDQLAQLYQQDKVFLLRRLYG